MIQTAEGALTETHSILGRMRELTVQAGNSTLSTADRTATGEEIFTLRTEIDNIATRTTFNGLSLLTGSLSTSQDVGNSTAIVGLAMNTTTTASLATVDVSKLAAGTTYTLPKVDADTISISEGTTTVICDLGTLASGAGATVAIVVTVVPSATGTITNTAGVTSNAFDTNPADNTDTERTTIQVGADLSIGTSGPPDPVAACR